MFWKRKPVTYSAALWVLVGLAVVGLIAAFSFAFVLYGLRHDAPVARPARHPAVNQEQAPSLLGVITAVDGSRLSVDSKQSFDTVLIDGDVGVSSVGGETRSSADLKAGTTIAATGRDLGRGQLGAYAIVIMDRR